MMQIDNEKIRRIAELEQEIERLKREVEQGHETEDQLQDQLDTSRKEASENKREYEILLENQTLLKSLLDSSSAVIFIKDLDGRYLLSNPVHSALLGAATKDILGKTGEDFEIISRVLDTLRGNDHKVASEGRSENFEETVQTLDGEDRTYLSGKFPLRGSNGEIHALGGISTDITALKQVERSLRMTLEEAEKNSLLLQTLLENIPEGFVITGGPPDFPIERVSRYGLEITRNPKPEELIGLPTGQHQVAWDLFLADGETRPAQEQMPLYRASRFGEVVKDEEIVIRTADGEMLTVLVNAVPVRDRDGNIIAAINTWRDYSERKRNQEALRKSEERFSKAYNASPDPMVISCLDDGKIIEVNQSFERLFGYSREEAIGETTLELNLYAHPSDRRKMVNLVLEQGSLRNLDVEMRSRTNKKYLMTASAEQMEVGGERHLLTVFHDETGRREAENALRRSNQLFRITLDNAPVLVYTTDRDLRYTWMYNPTNDFQSEEVVGKRDNELLPAEAVAELMAFKQSVLDSEKRARQEIHLPFNGQDQIYDVTAEPMWDDKGEVVGLTVVAVDRTEMRQLETEVLRKEEQVEIQRRIREYQEQERMRIARDLHDGPLQDLITTHFLIAEIKQADGATERKEKLDQLAQSLKDQAASLRSFCNELRPPMLAPFGLQKAIRTNNEELMHRYPDIQIVSEFEMDDRLISENISQNLYFIYQEGMNNILKHANATVVHVHIYIHDQQAELELRDNGNGFELPKNWVQLARQGHLGLVGMRERVEGMGGSIEILSAPGSGTKISVSVPLWG